MRRLYKSFGVKGLTRVANVCVQGCNESVFRRSMKLE
jgi:hypothetical protein